MKNEEREDTNLERKKSEKQLRKKRKKKERKEKKRNFLILFWMHK